MQKIQLMWAGLLTVCLSNLTGCSAVKAERGAVRLDRGAISTKMIEKGAITGPLLKIDPNAVSIVASVPPEAIKLNVEKGAVTVMPGAVTVNILSQKPPPMEIKPVVNSLKINLVPLGDISSLPKEQQDRIIKNDTIMQAAIASLLEMVKHYNENYADFKPALDK